MASTIADELPKIKLYWLEQSRSQRILWLLEELKIPYELEIFHRVRCIPMTDYHYDYYWESGSYLKSRQQAKAHPQTHLAGPELKNVHALGKSPVISVTPAGSSQSIIIAESAFIVEYLLEHFSNGSKLLPKRYKDGQEGKVGGETEEWLRFKYYLHYAEGSLMSLMLIALVALQIKNSSVPFFIKPLTNTIASKIQSGFLDPNFKTHFSFLESQLNSSPDNGQFLCGPHLTGADILLSFPLIAGRGRAGLLKEKYPKLYDYVDRLESEAGYKKAVAKIIEIEGKFEATF